MGSWTDLTAKQRALWGLPPGLEDKVEIEKLQSKQQDSFSSPKDALAKRSRISSNAKKQPNAHAMSGLYSATDGHLSGLQASSLEKFTRIESKLGSSTSPTKAFGNWCSPETSHVAFTSPPLKSKFLGLSGGSFPEVQDSADIGEHERESLTQYHTGTQAASQNNLTGFCSSFTPDSAIGFQSGLGKGYSSDYKPASRSSRAKINAPQGLAETSDRIQEKLGTNLAWIHQAANSGLKPWLARHIREFFVSFTS